jgi:hypothetical protein
MTGIDVEAAHQQKLLRTRRAALVTLNVLVFLGAAVFGLAELWEAFNAYASIGGSTVNPTAAEIAAIQICAVVSVMAALASVVLALVIGGRWALSFGILSAVGLVVAIALAVILLTHQTRGAAVPDVGPSLPSNQQPCYSGSNTCN